MTSTAIINHSFPLKLCLLIHPVDSIKRSEFLIIFKNQKASHLIEDMHTFASFLNNSQTLASAASNVPKQYAVPGIQLQKLATKTKMFI